jgi:hypothetical protein
MPLITYLVSSGPQAIFKKIDPRSYIHIPGPPCLRRGSSFRSERGSETSGRNEYFLANLADLHLCTLTLGSTTSTWQLRKTPPCKALWSSVEHSVSNSGQGPG